MPDATVQRPKSSAQAKAVIRVVAAACILACLWWIESRSHRLMTPVRDLGLSLALLGFAGWAAAHLELGRSFSVRAKATELVTQGVYSKIRNPIYFFGSLLIAGIILWITRPIWLLVLLIIVPMQIVRARKEAQVLEAKFGDVYRAYRAGTWF